MKAETLDRGRLAVTNPIDDTHETFNHLKDAGITEAQAEVFTQMVKGLADQTIQVNENLLMVRDELRGEIAGVHGEIVGIRGELKDIHHKIDSNYQSLDAKIDSNYQSLDKKIDFSHTTLLGYMEKSNAQAQAHQAQTQVSYMRWNIGLFIGLAGLMIALIRPWE